ncbi:MAG: sulfatase-like hydrolase/transferase, partial [Rickettsiales bacterium]|nr:sulfatase-like hydrolase/transferase [Rickettsiales bacterium]
GPAYYKRYPERFEKFKPTCETSELQDCPRESIVNTYDNTILYTDYFIAKTIEAAKKFPDRAITVIYTSDHGESLGENSIYLHGMPYAIAPEQQRKVPMILWMNERAKKTVDYECIKKAAKESLSHAILFHSILGLAEIKSELYEPDKDIFGKCGVKKRP